MQPLPLRIALIAPPWLPVPPTGYGGIEWVVSLLAEGLVRQGHSVTLFASGGSETSAHLISEFERAPYDAMGNPAIEAVHALMAYRRWREFDLIHDHTLLGLLAGAQLPVPVIHTVHGPVTDPVARFYARLGQSVRFINISKHQQSTMPRECATNVIYNATDATRYLFGEPSGEYLLFVGRMSPEKGIVDAIEIARRVGRPLRILAKINEPAERAYFRDWVAPALGSLEHQLVEETSHDEKAEVYRNAHATLFPINWDEPFGLVMTESMAAGTPVIGFRRGSVPEIIEHGRTGFICDSVDEAVDAVRAVHSLDRRACRERVERLFSVDLNIRRHEELYRTTIAQSGAAAPGATRRRAERELMVEGTERDLATVPLPGGAG
jgi:glycosyltransferase involved in cell wall biosynthesis